VSSLAQAHATCSAGHDEEKKPMFRTFMISAASTAVVAFSPVMFAQQGNSHGTPEEAKAMLTKAAAAVKADKSKAIDMFNKGDGGFLDRDLYVFCANVNDGKIVAQGNPNAKQILGQDQRTLKDASGRNFGAERWEKAGRSNHRSQLHICQARFRFKEPVGEGELGNQSQRSCLRCRLL
jgi:hypothetical protein